MTDLSGNDNDGVVETTSGAVEWVTDVPGSACSGALKIVNDAAKRRISSNLNLNGFPSGSAPRTIMTWMKRLRADSVAGFGYGATQVNSGTYYFVANQGANGAITAAAQAAYNLAGWNHDYAFTAFPRVVDVWHHVAITYNYNDDMVYYPVMFVDGVEYTSVCALVAPAYCTTALNTDVSSNTNNPSFYVGSEVSSPPPPRV